ncbi:ammonium transporter [Haloferax sp. DFSO60]|uniref:ammonium transporter n=1 Tax=Haloferax sp. DFSO60 TaxID=3388652 RepID=UPI00397E3236
MVVPLQTDLATIVEGVNLVWVLTVTFLIFFMHAGFAMLEAGQVRAKNVSNQLTKNLLTWSLGVIVFFLLGAAVSTIIAGVTGGPSVTITDAFMSLYAPDAAATTAWVDWLFGAVFAMTAATIVSGAVAGRARLGAYLTYTILIAGIIYPVVVGFTWAGGFLGGLGFHDFAGGMIVHGMGGIAGLTAAWVIGPRMNRFKPDGSANVIPGHSITFAVLGTLILAFGWYGFNVGTAAAPLAYSEADGLTLGSFAYVGRVALVTTLGMAAGALGAGGVAYLKTGKVDTLYVANGLLAGLVGITAIADDIIWPGAIIVGALAGAQLPFVFEFVEKRLRIDDVCAVFPVHGSAGMLGALLYPVFAMPVWHSGASVVSLAIPQIIGVVVIAIWTFAATALVFGAFRSVGLARVSADHERQGLDTAEHGVDTYPEFGAPDDAGIRADGGFTAGESTSDASSDGGLTADGFMTTRKED